MPSAASSVRVDGSLTIGGSGRHLCCARWGLLFVPMSDAPVCFILELSQAFSRLLNTIVLAVLHHLSRGLFI